MRWCAFGGEKVVEEEEATAGSAQGGEASHGRGKERERE
jgi:hypothetical protein